MWWRNRCRTPEAVTVPDRFKAVRFIGFRQQRTSSTPNEPNVLQDTSKVWILESEIHKFSIPYFIE
jgi:hypothetical protein